MRTVKIDSIKIMIADIRLNSFHSVNELLTFMRREANNRDSLADKFVPGYFVRPHWIRTYQREYVGTCNMGHRHYRRVVIQLSKLDKAA